MDYDEVSSILVRYVAGDAFLQMFGLWVRNYNALQSKIVLASIVYVQRLLAALQLIKTKVLTIPSA